MNRLHNLKLACRYILKAHRQQLLSDDDALYAIALYFDAYTAGKPITMPAEFSFPYWFTSINWRTGEPNLTYIGIAQ